MSSSRKIVPLILITMVMWVGPASAKRLSVAGEVANVRSGPGTDHEILWSVGKYYPVDVIKKSGSWYQISDFEGDRGWMHESLLRDIPAVVVKESLVNVRQGPGTNFKVLFQAEKGVSMECLREEKGWLKVKHADGEEGWIHKDLVWGP